MRIIIIFSFVFFISSCATSVTSQKKDSSTLTSSEQGYLLLGVESGFDLDYIILTGRERLKLTSADLQAGLNYLLIPVSAGIYEVGEVRTAASYRFIFDDEDEKDLWKIEVRPNAISYGGHLSVRTRHYYSPTARFELENRTSQTLDYMGENFPQLINELPLLYNGPGEDRFIQYARSIGMLETTE